MKKKSPGIIQTTEKETYRLWWKYLQRSSIYKNFCDWIRQKGFSFFVAFKKAPKRFRTPGGSFHPALLNFAFFGDIHRKPFDKWWEGILEKNQKDTGTVVEYTRERIAKEMTDCLEYHKRQRRRIPTLEEFMSDFFLWMTAFNDTTLFLKVAVTYEDEKVLGEKIAKIIRQKKRNPHAMKEQSSFKKYVKPTTLKRNEELSRYLDVYDQIEDGMSTQAITGKYRADPRQIRLWHTKAKNIIQNVERGDFPGKY